MKRMLFICAALLTASIASAVESANIVGYLKTTATGAFFSSGSTFVKCQSFINSPDNPQWRLGDVKAKNFDVNQDFVSTLDPVTGETGIIAVYSADGWGNPDWIGWWDQATQEISYNDEVFSASEGFLCNFSSENVEITYAGEVLTDATTVDFTGMTFPLIANFLPKDLTFGDISAEGFDVNQDFISTLDPVTGEAGIIAVYSADGWGNPDWIGWWDQATQEISYNDYPLPAGSVFLGNFSSPEVKISFPSPL